MAQFSDGQKTNDIVTGNAVVYTTMTFVLQNICCERSNPQTASDGYRSHLYILAWKSGFSLTHYA